VESVEVGLSEGLEREEGLGRPGCMVLYLHR
jgi:hypothetical protein